VLTVEVAGSIWERIMVGILLAHIPHSSEIDAVAKRNLCMRVAMDNDPRVTTAPTAGH
jgi:hypothetical protein